MIVRYRDASQADAATLDGVFRTVFCDSFGDLYRPEDLRAFLSSFDIADWERQLRDPAFAIRIAEAEGQPAGYVKLGPLKLPVQPTGPSMLIDQFYVLKEHHGSGMAQELMDWAIDEARRRASRALFLTVYIDNQRARRFYGRYGFQDVGRYDFMVGKQADEDAIMRLEL